MEPTTQGPLSHVRQDRPANSSYFPGNNHRELEAWREGLAMMAAVWLFIFPLPFDQGIEAPGPIDVVARSVQRP